MANYCSCNLVVSGARKEWTAVLEEKGFRFSNWLPELKDWSTSEVAWEELGETVSVKFDMVWGPPSRWTLEVSKRFPGTKFDLYYADSAQSFYGQFSVQNGVFDQDHKTNVWSDSDAVDPPECFTDEFNGFMEEHGLHAGG